MWLARRWCVIVVTRSGSDSFRSIVPFYCCHVSRKCLSGAVGVMRAGFRDDVGGEEEEERR